MVQNYEALANAIVIRACEDYVELGPIKPERSVEKQAILRFFRSRYFSILTDINAEWLIGELDKKIARRERGAA